MILIHSSRTLYVNQIHTLMQLVISWLMKNTNSLLKISALIKDPHLPITRIQYTGYVVRVGKTGKII